MRLLPLLLTTNAIAQTPIEEDKNKDGECQDVQVQAVVNQGSYSQGRGGKLKFRVTGYSQLARAARVISDHSRLKMDLRLTVSGNEVGLIEPSNFPNWAVIEDAKSQNGKFWYYFVNRKSRDISSQAIQQNKIEFELWHNFERQLTTQEINQRNLQVEVSNAKLCDGGYMNDFVEDRPLNNIPTGCTALSAGRISNAFRQQQNEGGSANLQLSASSGTVIGCDAKIFIGFDNRLTSIESSFGSQNGVESFYPVTRSGNVLDESESQKSSFWAVEFTDALKFTGSTNLQLPLEFDGSIEHAPVAFMLYQCNFDDTSCIDGQNNNQNNNNNNNNQNGQNSDQNGNQNNNQQNQSPVQQNPTVDVGVEMQGLRLALNTAQTGRTFQDRSHSMRIMRYPTGQPGTAAMQSAKKIVNVNVQGKRGNIVQTFPAVEYDFWPKIVEVETGDCIAFSWTGSNTHNNGNPAGDGQAGDAGEGRGGSDRSNLVQIIDKNSAYPAPLDKNVVTDFFKNSKVYRTYSGELVNSGHASEGADSPLDAQVYFASAGYFNTVSQINTDDQLPNNQDNVGGNARLQVLLNNAPASMRGMTVCPEVAGTYEFTCTRNNNFSNRDQKWTVHVK
jgi:plastocyanin